MQLFSQKKIFFICYSVHITCVDLGELGSGNSSKRRKYVLHGADVETYTPEVHKTAPTWIIPGHLGSERWNSTWVATDDTYPRIQAQTSTLIVELK